MIDKKYVRITTGVEWTWVYQSHKTGRIYGPFMSKGDAEAWGLAHPGMIGRPARETCLSNIRPLWHNG